MPKKKFCPKCLKNLAITEFVLDKNAKDSRKGTCKKCMKFARLNNGVICHVCGSLKDRDDLDIFTGVNPKKKFMACRECLVNNFEGVLQVKNAMC